MIDHHYAEPALAELYDAFCADRPDFAFYLPLVMSAASGLDVGCGTGELLRLAREGGHVGRLCGLDPAPAMRNVARRRDDVDWVLADLATITWRQEFDLIVMTGHAFQVLLDDDDLRTALSAAREALTDDGRFVFETRNPLVREWEQWRPGNAVEVMHNDVGARMEAADEARIDGDRVSFTTAYTSAVWDGVQLSHSVLRFLDAPALGRFLSEAGLVVEAQFGDWDRSALTDTSPEIITIAGCG